MTKKIDGRRETRVGDREDRRALLPPGRGGDGGGDDEEDRRERMPGCLALFSGWNKGRGTPTRRVADVPPPAPPALKELGDVKEHGDDKELQVADTTTIQAPEVKELPSEIDSKIVSMLDSVYDRSSLKAVCGRWRSATLSCPIAPLPLIINADYTLANCFLEGFDCVPKKMNPSIEHPPDNLSTCLGTLNNWIVVACEEEFHPQGNLDPVHNRCYLIQPIKGTPLSLPNPCSFESTGGRLSSLHILHGEGSFSWYQPVREGHLRLQKVALCRSAGHLNFRTLVWIYASSPCADLCGACV